MMIQATVIADSRTPYTTSRGAQKTTPPARITTLELVYPRFIHGEVMTHRVFSRNAMSSRAVPVAKMIQQVRDTPAMPVFWGKNQPGMQAAVQFEGAELGQAMDLWLQAAQDASVWAERMAALGMHKQLANRVLEPFQWMRTIVTATEWANFFALRCHPDAQPEFQALANAIRVARGDSVPVERTGNYTDPDAWHLPYVSETDRSLYRVDLLPQLSAARCARVSYLNHDGTDPSVEADVALFQRLVGSQPLHASPIEHQALPIEWDQRSNNFVGWTQYRELYELQVARAEAERKQLQNVSKF